MAKIILSGVLKRKKVSKRQFAKRLNISYSNVFRYFKPIYDPKLSTLQAWAKALSCKISDLFEE